MDFFGGVRRQLDSALPVAPKNEIDMICAEIEA